MAEKCNIHKTTAFYWRHKILDRMNDIVNKQVLKGNVEIDETLVPVAFKEKIAEAPKKRGISENKINIACGIDKHNHIRCIVSERGRITSKALIKIYKDFIEDQSIMISDSLRSYHKLVKEIDVIWKKIPSKKKEIEGYTLDKVNALHSSIKHYLYQLRGVGAKYLQNYISLFVYQWEHGEVASYERALGLFKELNWNYKGTRNIQYNPENRKFKA